MPLRIRYAHAPPPRLVSRPLLLLIGLTLLACAAPLEAAERFNVLLMVSDDQRPDTIAALGNPHIRTPNLDALARRGLAMRRAVCANPICTPSRAELLTGCTGFRNGVLDFGRRTDPQRTAWAQAMGAAGYQTFYVGKWHNNGRPSLHGYQQCEGLFASGGGKWARPQTDWRGQEVTGYRGWIFQSADGSQKHPERGVGLRADISRDFADAAIHLMRQRDDARPFFLHLNFTAPHDPLLIPEGEAYHYDPERIPLPENYLPEHPFDHGNFEGRDEKLLPWPRTKPLVRQTIAAYYSVITHMDEQIGRVLEELNKLGIEDRTLVIFTSDHGLAVGSHGLRGKQNMYEHTIGVPMLVAGPGVRRGESAAPIYLRDLYPSVCRFCDVPLPDDSLDGVSHADVWRGEAESHHEEVFGYFRQHQRMIRRGDWKLIHYPLANRTQLFNLKDDPAELTDLSQRPEHQQLQAALRGRLADWLEQQQAR